MGLRTGGTGLRGASITTVSTVAIRQASEADAETLVDLRERMLVELEADDRERLADLRARSLEWLANAMPDGEATGWLAERDGRVVGGVSLTLLETQPQYRSPSGRLASVYGLFVEPDERGHGTATALVRAALDFARSRDVDLVTLHAADKARPLYERLGFTPTKEMRLQFSEEAPQTSCGA